MAQPSAPSAQNPFSSPTSPMSPQGTANPMEQVTNMIAGLGALVAQGQEQTRAVMNAFQGVSSHLSQDRKAQSWSRHLPRPEVFKPKDREEELTMWQDWAWTFKQWVLAVNPEIHTGLEEIEKDLTTECVEDTMTDDAVAQGKQLYSMLTTLLRERPLNLLKSVEGNNGYEAWRILSCTLAPKSKTRALALLGAIAQYPAMTAQNLLEQVLKMEDLFRKYEQASGKAVPDEMKSALLLRVLPQQVKYHLTINVHEDSTYDEMREVLLRWDRSSQKWSSQIVTGGVAHSNNSGPQDGPVPMEVDRVYSSGKGKDVKGKDKGWGKSGKGKFGKGKDGFKGYQNGKSAGKFGNNNFKGGRDDKGKGKQWGKGGGKSGGKTGKGSGFTGGKSLNGACRICGKMGHWGNECWMKNRVQNVASPTPSMPQPQLQHVQPFQQHLQQLPLAPTSATATSTASVKRIFNLAESDFHDHIPLTTVHEMESVASETRSRCSSESWWCRAVQYFDMSEFDRDEEVLDCALDGYEVHDLTMFDALDGDVSWVEEAKVRGIQVPTKAPPVELSPGDVHEVVLDSGADVSVMPRSWMLSQVGELTDGKSVRMLDAQGRLMANHGSKNIVLDFGPACIQDEFYASDVHAPLLSLGRLLRRGWSLDHKDGILCLCHAVEAVTIPVSFKKNSLVVDAQVMMVRGEVPEVRPVKESRIVVHAGFDLHARGAEWSFLDCGDPCAKRLSTTRVDPSSDMGVHLWQYRTTLIYRYGEWELIDFVEPLKNVFDLSAAIEGVEEPIPVFTIMHRTQGDPEKYGLSFVAEKADAENVVDDIPNFADLFEPQGGEIELPGVAEEDEPADASSPAPAPVMVPGPGDDHVIVEGIRLGPTSSSQTLRTACRTLGLGMSGSKASLFRRLLSHTKRRELENAMALEHAAQPITRAPRAERQPGQPTEEERASHELTHLPFKSWCGHCVSSRSRRDAHHQDGEKHDADGGDPIIAFDFFYTDVSGDELDFMRQKPAAKDVMTVLIVVDKSTGMCRAIPLPSKGEESLVHGAKEILGFISYLGYQAVGIRGDNEPAAQALTRMICQSRCKLGLKTIARPSQPYEHATNGAAEQAVQGIRDLGTTLLQQLKEKSALELTTGHEVVGWAYVHASFLHNAFAVRGGTTPFERAFGVIYKGKLACFGEVVYFALNQNNIKKGKPKFIKGVFLGKSLNNDMNVCGTALGVYLSSTVRRLPADQQWSKHMLKEMQGRPYKYSLGALGSVIMPGMKERVRPEVIEEAPLAIAPPAPLKPPPPVDEAASDPSSSSRSPRHSSSGGARSEVPDLHDPLPSEAMADAAVPEAMDVSSSSQGDKRPIPEVEQRVQDPSVLQAPPLYAGSPSKHPRVSAVRVGDQEYYILDEHLDETWQDLDHDELYENDWSDEEPDWGDRTEGEGPPVLTSDILERTEMASRKTEIERLLNMKVLEEVPELPPGAKMLQTRHVMDWRFREGRWIRRARLVCKELRIWDPNRQGVYAPSTNPSISKLLPAIVVSRADWQLMAFDVKDAFLTVPQRDELYVNLDGLAYRVHRCLPGQQMASAMWGEQLAEDLRSTGLVADAACPAAFGCPGMGATVHVDDGLVGGTTEGLDAVKRVLQQKYKLEVSDYMRNVGDSVKFLKKELIMVEEGIQLKLNPRYLEKICESLKLSRTRPRKTPCGPEISQPDETEPLDEVAASRYRAAIGSFLYLSPDRPDCQWTIGHLARSMSKPTKKMYKHACHLAEYLQCTKDVNLTMKWSYPGRSALDERKLMRDEAQALQLEKAGEPDLLESFSDSDWAGHWDRISSTCGHLYFNGNVTFCFVRKQGCISLSSCEAELVACCSAAAEALYVRHVVETLTSHSCRITCRLDSSSARSLLLKKGVSKVRHLDTKLLWLQRSHSQGQLELSAVGTHLNTSDIGTKQLTSERYRFLLDRMGYATDLMPGFHNVTQIRKVEAKVVKYLMVLEALRSLPPASAQSASHDEPNVEMTNFEVVFQSSNALSIKGADLIGILISVVIIVGLTLRLLCSCSRWWSGVRRQGDEHHRGHHQPGDEHHRGHHQPGDEHHQGHHQPGDEHHREHHRPGDEHQRVHHAGDEHHREHHRPGDEHQRVHHAGDEHQRVHHAGDGHQRVRHAEDLHQGHRHAEDLHQGHRRGGDPQQGRHYAEDLHLRTQEAEDVRQESEGQPHHQPGRASCDLQPHRHEPGYSTRIQQSAVPNAHHAPRLHESVRPFPRLQFAPRFGESYHMPNCRNLLSARTTRVYTFEDHQRNPLAPCQACNPPVLEGSRDPPLRRRRGRR